MAVAESQPQGILLPYATSFFENPTRVKLWEKSRRIGASWSTAAVASVRAAAKKAAAIRGMDVWYIGYNKDMAVEFINDCAFWSREYQLAAGAVQEEVFEDEDKDILTFVIRYASGHRVTALSSRPSNLRGKQGIVIIDEAGFHEDLPGLMKAAIALLMWGGEVWVISSHNGVESDFNLLIEECRAGKKPYYVHKTTLDDALEDGLYQRICLKLGREWTPEGEKAWRQELVDFYGEDADEELFCIPSLSGGKYFSIFTLEQAMRDCDAPILRLEKPDSFTVKSDLERTREISDWLRLEVEPIFTARVNPNLKSFVGQDFARDSGLSCFLPIQEMANLVRAPLLALEMRNIPFEQQRQILFWFCDRLPNFCGGALDARGNGHYLSEVAMQRYGELRIHQIKATPTWYGEHWPKYRAGLEGGKMLLPNSTDWKDDHRLVESIKGIPTLPDKTFKGSDGKPRHGDSAIAGLLAYFASLNPAAPIEFQSVRNDRFSSRDFVGAGRGNGFEGFSGGGFGGFA